MKKIIFILLTAILQFSQAKCFDAQRIITLAPNLTELVYSVGAGSQLIAVDTASDYPASAKRLTKVASYRGIDLEKIVKLHPDLILAWRGGNPAAQLAQLQQLGFHVEQFSLLRLQQIPIAIRRIGCYSGHRQQAQHLANRFLATVKRVQQQNRHKKRLGVFLEMSASPLQTLSQHSLLNDMVESCAGYNIFANLVGSAPQVSLESVLQANPQVMIFTQKNWKNNWQKWRNIEAVKKGNLFTLNPDVLYRATFRSLKGLKAVCHALDVARARSSV